MTPITEAPRPGSFLVSEANGTLSRDTFVIASGQTLKAGAVVGKLTATGKYVELAPGSYDGDEAAAGILYAGVDAAAGDQQGVVVNRYAEVAGASLIWPTGITTNQKAAAIAELLDLGIKVR
jgi:hypothetical protein